MDGTGLGLAKYDETTWRVFKTANSDLPNSNVSALAVDDKNIKWIGTYGSGLAKFNGSDWIVYNSSNSGLPDDNVHALLIESSGIKWIGTEGGLPGSTAPPGLCIILPTQQCRQILFPLLLSVPTGKNG